MLFNLCATDTAALLKQYWYIAVAAIIVLGVIIATVIVCLQNFIKQAKENSAVSKARKEQLEISKRNAEKAATASMLLKQEQSEEDDGSDEDGELLNENSAQGNEESADAEQSVTEEKTAEQTAENKENMQMEKKQKAETKTTKAKETETKTTKTKAPVEDETEIVVEGQEAAVPGKPATKALYRVIYDKENKEWMVKKDGAARVIRRVKTKAEALELANQFATNQDLSMVVQKKDGKFQKKSNYNKMITPAKGEKKK